MTREQILFSEGGGRPSISFDNDPLGGAPGSWSMATPTNSANAFTGVWQDVDAAPSAPIAGIVFTVDGIVIPGNLNLGNASSNQPQVWSFSTAPGTLSYAHDQRQLRATITDASGQSTSAFAKLNIPYDDPIRTLTDHPSPKTAVFGLWSFVGSPPAWQPDSTRGGTTWVVDGSPYDGGVVIPEAGIKLTLTGSTLVPGSIGVWQPQFRILLKDAVSRVEFTVRKNAVIQPEMGFWIAGPWVSGAFSQEDELNILMASMDVQNGDTWEIEMKGYVDGVGSPTAADLPLWEWTHMNYRGVVSPPPPVGTAIFSWVAGQAGASQADWNAYRALLPLAYGSGLTRPQGKNVTRLTLANGHQMLATEKYEVATMEADGTLVMQRYPDTPTDEHNQVSPRRTGISQITDGLYLKPNIDWQLDIDNEFDVASYSFSDWLNVANWGVLTDFHPGAWPAGWLDQQPPVGLYVDQDGGGPTQFLLRVRGSTAVDPTVGTKNYTHSNTYWVANFSPGRQTYRIQIRFDYTGVTAFVKVWWNNTLRVNVTPGTQPIGINHSASAVKNAMFMKCGWYAHSSTVGALLKLRKVELRDITPP